MPQEWMRRMAKPMLFGAAIIWGASFFIMKNTLDVMPVFYLLAVRFTAGAGLLGLLFLPRWRQYDWGCVWRGALAGAFLFAGYAVQTFGLLGTTPSKNAFLTSVYCVIVPFLYWLVSGCRPDRFHLAGAVMCVAGVGMVSLTEALTITWGDWLTLLCAVLYAAYTVSAAQSAKSRDVCLITVLQFAFAALYAWICCWAAGEETAGLLLRQEVLLPMAYLCVMATAAAILFQNVGQAASDPVSASVILSLESVFGVLFSVLFYHDPVTGRLLAGFGLILLAVLCSETKFAFLRRVRPDRRAE